MAEYKDIHGTNIETVTTDPSNPITGQVWYNTTEQKLKGLASNPAGSWSTSGALNTGRTRLMSTGIQTAALAIGGETDDNVALNELYNGSTWTEVGDLNTARKGAGEAGTSTASIIFGGNDPSNDTDSVESWDGSSWTEIADINTARRELAGAGTSTAALAFGGNQGPGSVTESWNGTSWTEVADLGTAI